MKASVGQIWASTDSRDTRINHRQRRIVTRVDPACRPRAPYGRAFLRTMDDVSPYTGSFGVQLAADGSIRRHRYVSPGLDPERVQDAAQRAANLDVEADDLYAQALAKRAEAERLRETWMLPA
jgi:hypothetical protein